MHDSDNIAPRPWQVLYPPHMRTQKSDPPIILQNAQLIDVTMSRHQALIATSVSSTENDPAEQIHGGHGLTYMTCIQVGTHHTERTVVSCDCLKMQVNTGLIVWPYFTHHNNKIHGSKRAITLHTTRDYIMQFQIGPREQTNWLQYHDKTYRKDDMTCFSQKKGVSRRLNSCKLMLWLLRGASQFQVAAMTCHIYLIHTKWSIVNNNEHQINRTMITNRVLVY